jgi:histone H3/H4
MRKKLIFRPKDLIEIYKILKRNGILEFEEIIPSFLLEFIYEIIWKILCKAKILSKHAKRIFPTLIDIEIACKLELKEVEDKVQRTYTSNFYENIINTIPLPDLSDNNFFELPDKNLQLVEKNFLIKKVRNKM